MTRQRLWLFVVGMLLVPGVAVAHGRFPATVSVSMAGNDASKLVVGTTFGLLVPRDGEWRWICEEAIELDQFTNPVVTYSGDAYLVGSRFGLKISRDQGCSWTTHQELGEAEISDVQADVQDSRSVFLTTSNLDAPNAVFYSPDEGLTFSTRLLESAHWSFGSVRQALSAPDRLYVSAWSFAAGHGAIFRSQDRGQSWSEVGTGLPGGIELRVLAVHPTNEQELLVSAVSTTGSTLYRSTDGAQTFASVLQVGAPMRGATYDQGGQRLWVAAERLHISANGGDSFTALESPTQNACVFRGADAVYACGWPWTDGWAVGRGESSTEFGEYLSFRKLAGVLHCPEGSSVQRECGRYWPALAITLGLEQTQGTESPRPAQPPVGCGCASSDSLAGWSWWVLLLLGRVRRRRPAGYVA